MSTHTLSLQVPSTTDYLKGGFGDLVAQCSCGAYEYVYSSAEGAYWHALHVARPTAHPADLLIDRPMPEGWTATPPVVVAQRVPAAARAPRTYACPTCMGAGTVPAGYSAFGHGRYYSPGERVTCLKCSGSGRTDAWLEVAA